MLAAALSACATPPTGPRADPRVDIEAGLDLYESGELVLAARRFRSAAGDAREADDTELERRAVTAECLCWLRARKLQALAACSERLESLQRRARQHDPGVNTLVALGAVAGDRPLPSLRIPNAVQPMIQASTRESK